MKLFSCKRQKVDGPNTADFVTKGSQGHRNHFSHKRHIVRVKHHDMRREGNCEVELRDEAGLRMI